MFKLLILHQNNIYDSANTIFILTIMWSIKFDSLFLHRL